MKNRSKNYFNKTRARKTLEHPTDLKTFLKAEFDLTCNSFVKKDILRVIEQLEKPLPVNKTAMAEA